MREFHQIPEDAAQQLVLSDQHLANLVKDLGLIRFPVYPDHFYSLVMSVVFQQLSFKGAETIFNRLVNYAGYPLEPSVLVEFSEDDFRQLGISRQKAAYINDLSWHFLNDRERFHTLHEQSDELVIKNLCEIKGIGVWTAQMFLMFTLLRNDVFPVDDLGIRKAMIRWCNLSPDAPRKAFSDYAERWRPYRSFACHYLWHAHDQ